MNYLKRIIKINIILLMIIHVRTEAMETGEPLLDKTISRKQISVPLFGIGTYESEQSSLECGLNNGFRLIDTAKAYGNEEMVGTILKNFEQEPIIVITKLFRPNCQNKESLRNAVLDSNKKLGRVPDFFLIHGPYPDVNMLSLFTELELMKKDGLVNEWGVSNFDNEHLEFLVAYDCIPSLNQVEYHPFFQREQLLKFCKEHDIILQAYRPLAKGEAVKHEIIKTIAAGHGVKPAVVIYSWLAMQEIPMVTKVSSEKHQKEYLESKQITFSTDEINAIAALSQPEGMGRTCKKGGWYTPFTQEVKNRWLENN